MSRSLLSFLLSLFLISVLATSCQEKRDYLYDINPEEVVNPIAGKTKEKSYDQYIAILYANLFQQALPADELAEIRQLMESIGDKELAKEVVISNFMNRPGVILPDEADMRADIPGFVRETYKRFFVREPSEAELAWTQSFIESNPDVTPELVYVSFALSEEYQFY